MSIHGESPCIVNGSIVISIEICFAYYIECREYTSNKIITFDHQPRGHKSFGSIELASVEKCLHIKRIKLVFAHLQLLIRGFCKILVYYNYYDFGADTITRPTRTKPQVIPVLEC